MYDFCQWNLENVYVLVNCAQMSDPQPTEVLVTNSGNNYPNSTEESARSDALPSNQPQPPNNGRGCRPLYCDRCGKVFYLKSNLRTHMMSYRYPCSICTDFFRTKPEIVAHVKEKHGLVIPTPVGKYQYPCSECDYKTRNVATLTEHILRQHTDKYAYGCEYCPQEFKVKSDLNQHMKQEHLVTKCFLCSAVLKHHKALVSHIKSKHGEQPNQCKRCKRTLESQESLERHMRWHSDITKRHSIPCPTCGKLVRDYKFSAHLIMHNDKKANTCRVCGKVFRKLCGLQKHLVSHSGNKPYPCDTCKQNFSTKQKLCQHRQRRHPGPQPPVPTVSIANMAKDSLQTYSRRGMYVDTS